MPNTVPMKLISETLKSGRIDAVPPALTHVADNAIRNESLSGKFLGRGGLYALLARSSLAYFRIEARTACRTEAVVSGGRNGDSSKCAMRFSAWHSSSHRLRPCRWQQSLMQRRCRPASPRLASPAA